MVWNKRRDVCLSFEEHVISVFVKRVSENIFCKTVFLLFQINGHIKVLDK